MADFDIQLTGFDYIARNFSNAGGLVDKAQKQMLEMATMMAWGKAKELAPVDKDTLRGSIYKNITGDTGRVGSPVPYAKYQEYGTGIYSDHPSAPKTPITPKRAPFLQWQDKNGIFHRAKQVMGSKPRRFIRGGLAEVQEKMSLIVALGKKIMADGLLFK